MKIIVAKDAGFCSGVRRAVDLVYGHIDGDYKLYSIGPLIHNPQAIKEMEKQGLIIEEEIDNVESGGMVIIRSHGVPEDVYQKLESRGLQVVDATCHFVKKIHRLVREYSQNGYDIIIVGQKEHPEVVGIQGWCIRDAYILSEPAQADALPLIAKACIVAQTTISHDLWDEILGRLRQKLEHMEIFNTICNTTGERQKEAVSIAKMVDAMFVVGGKDSSNTQKLYSVCKAECPNTVAVETADQIDILTIGRNDVIGITAGASTPDWVIKEVIDKMAQLAEKDIPKDEEALDQSGAQIIDEQILGELVTEQLTDEPPTEEHPVPQQNQQEEIADAQVAEHHSEDLDTMTDFHKTMVILRPGEVVKGIIISVSANEIIVNVGYKSDGILPASEVAPNAFKPGDHGEFEVVKVNDGEGNVILSRKAIERRRAWKRIEESLDEGRELEGMCVEVTKGGVIATLHDIQTFVPASQLSTSFVGDLTAFVGKPLRLKVIEVDRRRNRVVASQRAVLETERQAKRKLLWDSIQEGQTITGTVMRLADFGVFVDLGGVDGLIRMHDLSWRRVAHPREVVKEGQQIDVVVLSVNKETERISLSYKQAHPHPWEGIESRYQVGDIVVGKVARIATFGAFVELEPGVDGLVHISQISQSRVDTVEKALRIGQSINAKILKIDPEMRKISLSIKDAIEHTEQEGEITAQNAQTEEKMEIKLSDFFPEA